MESCFFCSSEFENINGMNFCGRCNYTIHETCFSSSDSMETQRRKINSIYMWLLRRHSRGLENRVTFYCYDSLVDDESNNPNIDDNPYMINVDVLLRSYPRTLLQRIDAILLNIVSKYNDMGTFFSVSSKDKVLMFCETDNEEGEIHYVLKMMVELGYIVSEEDTLDESIYRCQITLSGWKRIEELNAQENTTNQAFIAMKFGEETEMIARTFKRAILAAGYVPYKMDEIEHNNQIIPEMFFEIKRSRMLVIDVTVPNLGAYYEAGYAQALGKEVIVCCEKIKSKKAHFDISQKNMILWNTYDELEEKLIKRIEATVGKKL